MYPHAKIHLRSLEVVSTRGFSRADIQKIASVASAYQDYLLEAWGDYFAEEE